MNFFQIIREGFLIARNSLRAHGSRTFLTMLGVAIGIFAITIIFTMVNSLTYNLSKNINALGPTTLFVSKMPWSNEELANWQKLITRPPVTYSDFRKLDRNVTGVDGVCYRISIGSKTLKFKSNSIEEITTMGITQDYAWLNNFEFQSGRPFSEVETQSGRAVIILGHTVAEQLFLGSNPIDKYIRMNGKKLKVVGVLSKTGSDVFGNTVDEQCFVPYTFAAKIYNVYHRRADGMIMVRGSSEQGLPLLESEITGLIRSERGLRPRSENNFSVNKPEMIMDLVGQVAKYLRIGGIIISIFSVIVGGFGIGNIMFATVKERTFEIGLQKALGATRAFVQFQFLTESVILCLIGGAVGLALNFGIAALIKLFLTYSDTDFELVISVGSIVTGVLLSVFIGLISGYIPSVIASRMNPIDSMRG